jgi:hypothetical protein
MTQKPVPTLRWRHFAIVATLTAAIFSFIARYGVTDNLRIPMMFVAVWIIAFVGYRFRLIMKEQADGTFATDRYKADPAAYFSGPRLPQIIWVSIAVVLVTAYIFFRHWRQI